MKKNISVIIGLYTIIAITFSISLASINASAEDVEVAKTSSIDYEYIIDELYKTIEENELTHEISDTVYMELKEIDTDYKRVAKMHKDEIEPVTPVETIHEDDMEVIVETEPEPVVNETLKAQPDTGTKIFENEDLSAELQNYAYEKTREAGIDFHMFMAMMWSESRYTATAISPGGDYGLCQVRYSNHSWINEALGRELDYLDPYDNMDASILIFETLINNEGADSIEEVLLYYAMGPSGAREAQSKGIYTIPATEKILNKYHELKNV